MLSHETPGHARRCLRREDVMALDAYEARRPLLRPQLLRQKRMRQVFVGDALNFLFESVETLAYQIQEIVRAEQISNEARIHEELATYNAVLGGPGQLGCTLLVEINAASRLAGRVEALADLREHLYLRLADGSKVGALPEQGPRAANVSLVQFLTFEVGHGQPVSVGATHPYLSAETLLSAEQQRVLLLDASASQPRGRSTRSLWEDWELAGPHQVHG